MNVSYACVVIGRNDQRAVWALAERNDYPLDVAAVAHNCGIKLDRECGAGAFKFMQIAGTWPGAIASHAAASSGTRMRHDTPSTAR